MMRLAHLSDIHLSPLPPVLWRSLMSKRITGYVNWQRNRKRSNPPEILASIAAHVRQADVDHIAITGDLVNLALEAEFVAIRSWLEALGHPSRVTVVCGNHDAYVPGALHRALGHWQPYVVGDNQTKISGNRDYPILRRRGEVSIIGCNSARASLPFLAVGEIGVAQSHRLASMLEQEGKLGRYRVVLIHHPPFSRATANHKRLIGAKRFRKAIENAGAELVLHGHTHIESFEQIKGPTGAVPVIGVPSAGQAPGGKRPAGRYNLFEIDGSPGAWRTQWRQIGYDKAGMHIGELSQQLL